MSLVFPQKSQLEDLLTMQDSMNQKVNPDWFNAGYAWHRAAYQETSEAIDEHGWKWWKKQTPNLPHLQMELVDIWHFDMSMRLVHAAGVLKEKADTASVIRYAADLLLMEAEEGENGAFIDGEHHDFTKMDLLGCLETLLMLYSLKRTSLGLFSRTLELAGMTWEELYVKYLSKHALNFFRQDHGYKEGTYKKIWNGREDNEVLDEVVEKCRGASDFYGSVVRMMAEEYAKVV